MWLDSVNFVKIQEFKEQSTPSILANRIKLD
jgi:hypothetical protein